MFQPLIALGLFAAIVWVIAYAIFLLLRNDTGGSIARGGQDPITRFVEENYGSHFLAESPLPQDCLRCL